MGSGTSNGTPGLTIPCRNWHLNLYRFRTAATNFLDRDEIGNPEIFLPLTVDGRGPQRGYSPLFAIAARRPAIAAAVHSSANCVRWILKDSVFESIRPDASCANEINRAYLLTVGEILWYKPAKVGGLRGCLSAMSSSPRVVVVTADPLTAAFVTSALAGLARAQQVEPAGLGAGAGGGDVFIIPAGEAPRMVLRALTRKPGGRRAIAVGPRLKAQEVAALLLAGAQGYAPYSALPSRLGVAVTRVLGGRFYFYRPGLEEICRALQENPRALRPGGLTERQRQVVGLAAGLSNGEIAARLQLSAETVKFHLSNAFRALGVSCRAQAVEAVRAGAVASGDGRRA